MVATMTKKQRQRMQTNQIESVQQEPKARLKFVPQNCSMCLALRQNPEVSYSFVYHTAGNVRYCKCGKCGHTWKETSSNLPAS